MKKGFLVLALLFCGLGASASQPTSMLFANPLDFTAPVIFDRSTLTTAPAGQIVFETNSGQFWGLPTSGAGGSLGNWTALSAPAGSNPVISTGAIRVEYAYVGLCNSGTGTGVCNSVVNSNSGAAVGTANSWLANVNRAGTGVYSFDFGTINGVNAFSNTPSCTFTGNTSQNAIGVINGTINATTWNFEIEGSNNGTSVDAQYVVTCVGPK
jgi:hypothetical protein